MTEELKISIIFFIGVLSSYLGCFMSGGVSALSFSFLTFLGIPPQLATVTVKLGKIGDILGGRWVFYKNGYVKSRYIFIGWPIFMTGSFLGTYLICTNVPGCVDDLYYTC